MATSIGIEVISYNRTTAEVASEFAEQAANEAARQFTDALKDELQPQIDGQIMSWFYNYNPTLLNEPSVLWQTETEKSNHLGDLFYNTNTGIAYRFSLIDDVYQWDIIRDTAVTEALAMAAKAQDTADHKKRIFITPIPDTDPPFTPVAPYDIGDLWAQGISGDLKRCINGNSIEGTYIASDWDLATKYTDDTALFDFVDVTYALDQETMQNQIDGKIETWFQVNDPNVWNTQEERNYHNGDMWFKTDVGYLYRYNSNTNIWDQIQDSKTVQAYDLASQAKDTADRKRTVFVAEPYGPYDIGDLWAVAADYNEDTSIRSELMKCIVSRTQIGYYNRSDWSKATKYTDDTTALAAQQEALLAKINADNAAQAASNAYLEASKKRQNFVDQPTTPYTYGDTWQDGSALYTCISSRSEGSFQLGDWAIRVNYDSTSVTMANGIVTAGSLRVKDANGTEWGGLKGGGDPSQIALWLGASYSNAEYAPFYVRHNGTMFAYAGSIAGWTLAGNRLVRDTGNNYNSCGMAPDDVPFFAGATYANRWGAPFLVTLDGTVYLSKANISTGTSGQRFSLNSNQLLFTNDAGSGYLNISMGSFSGFLFPQMIMYMDYVGIYSRSATIKPGEFRFSASMSGWPEAYIAAVLTNTVTFIVSGHSVDFRIPGLPGLGGSGRKLVYWNPSNGKLERAT